MNIYVRKVYKHDITHQISITKEIASNFFNISQNAELIEIIGKKSGVKANVSILLATDPRFGGDIKKLIDAEGGMQVNDFLLFTKNKKRCTLEIIKLSDRRYYSISDLLKEDRHLVVLNDNQTYEPIRLSNQLSQPHQRIFFGAPGTGKSYTLNKEARENFGENFDRVTFHPNYMYGNFVGSYKPFPKVLTTKDGSIKRDEDGNIQESITYEYISGILIKQLINAFKNPSENYLLIIEEINRANVASVFGDIFQLLDRTSSGDSEYTIATSKELQIFLKKEFGGYELDPDIIKKLGNDFSKLYLPRNLYIWATMNSADQGVMPMDTAFRRRWEFTYLGINDSVNENIEGFNQYRFKINNEETVKWDDFRREVNKRLSALHIPEDKLMGPYFVSKSILEETDIDKLTDTIKNKVLMYLYEDAAKAFRSQLFKDGKYDTYSTLCKNFDENALYIFKENLEISTNRINETNQDGENVIEVEEQGYAINQDDDINNIDQLQVADNVEQYNPNND